MSGPPREAGLSLKQRRSLCKSGRGLLSSGAGVLVTGCGVWAVAVAGRGAALRGAKLSFHR